MVNICAIMGCSNRSARDKGVSFYRLPAEITVLIKGKERRRAEQEEKGYLLFRIHRDNFKLSNHTRVCSKHFVGGK